MQKTKKLLTIGITAIVLVSILALMPAPSSAVTRIVPSLAYPTIQAAITAAGSGDTVQVLAGTYAPSTSHEVFPINMRDGVSLLGAGADITILDAEGANSVVSFSSISDTTTTIDGFTITGGLWCGIYNSNSSPVITNNIITGNFSGIDNLPEGAAACLPSGRTGRFRREPHQPPVRSSRATSDGAQHHVPLSRRRRRSSCCRRRARCGGGADRTRHAATGPIERAGGARRRRQW